METSVTRPTRSESAVGPYTAEWKSMGFSPDTRERSAPQEKPNRQPFEARIARMALLLVLPGLALTGILVWLQAWSIETKLILLAAELTACLLIGLALRDEVVRPLQTLANVVAALRQEDYSLRARVAVPDDALGELSLELNALADVLAQQRTGVVEARALVQRVVEEVDVPIFSFDPDNRLQLVNSAGERLLQQPAARLLGRTASELRLNAPLSCENESIVQLQIEGHARWFVRRSSFRQQGLPHTLVVLSDVSRALREEERRAWQRLIRVLGHELNNSLAPIKSIAGSLSARLSAANLENEQRQDFETGLSIIETRAASLNRFLQAYRSLAQMPPPSLRRVSIAPLMSRVAAMETRAPVTVLPGPEVTVAVDPDQLEQMLINLLRNAVEAALQASAGENGKGTTAREPRVEVTWQLNEADLVISIRDNGPGLMNPGNVFVPFYTTKPTGSGIGLLLSRQIAEAHGGSLVLTNRTDQIGCEVVIRLPVSAAVG